MSAPLTNRPLVTIIIPAYNAQETLPETLESVRAQTYENIEIIVVNDGSKDGTAALARRIAQSDPRIRVIDQANAGVAEARNHGIREARGEYLSFVDADDLWTPGKTAGQVAAMQDNGGEVGLVYSWSALIDEDSIVLHEWDRPRVAGKVLSRLFRANFVGNGSSIMVKADLAREVGGFEPRLHRLGAQGCEDIMFYLKIAALSQFAVVPEHQVGYRLTEGNMSSNAVRMFRSWLLVAEEMRLAHPRQWHHINSGIARYAWWLFEREIIKRRFDLAGQFLLHFVRTKPTLIPALGMCLVGSLFFRLRWSADYNLRYRFRLLPRHKGTEKPMIFGRRFKSGRLSG